jgi:hypothetical protein
LTILDRGAAPTSEVWLRVKGELHLHSSLLSQPLDMLAWIQWPWMLRPKVACHAGISVLLDILLHAPTEDPTGSVAITMVAILKPDTTGMVRAKYLARGNARDAKCLRYQCLWVVRAISGAATGPKFLNAWTWMGPTTLAHRCPLAPARRRYSFPTAAYRNPIFFCLGMGFGMGSTKYAGNDVTVVVSHC